MTAPANPFDNKGEAVGKITGYLDGLIAGTGLRLEFTIRVRGDIADPLKPQPAEQNTAAVVSHPPGPAASAAAITVEFTGPDTALLLTRNGELLHSIEHVAAKILRLEPEDHDLISFDAEGFKADRDSELTRTAEVAIQQVRSTGRPFTFAPMTSRERRMLHLILSRSGLATASSGEVPRRFVVLYPEGSSRSAESLPGFSADGSRSSPTAAAERTEAIRNRFRRR